MKSSIAVVSLFAFISVPAWSDPAYLATCATVLQGRDSGAMLGSFQAAAAHDDAREARHLASEEAEAKCEAEHDRQGLDETWLCPSAWCDVKRQP